MESIELEDHIFHSPSNISIRGPSFSGKTTLLMEILKYRNQLFSQPVRGVVYAYSEYQEAFKDPPGGPVHFHYGLPSEEELKGYIRKFEGHHFLLVFDDLMAQMSESSLIQDIMTKIAHHSNATTITLCQNIFPSGRSARTQAVNSHYYILTRTCRDLKQISVLGSQMFPGKTKEFTKIYRDAVDNPMNDAYPPHLLISCHPFKTRRDCQLLSNLFPPGGNIILYRLD